MDQTHQLSVDFVIAMLLLDYLKVFKFFIIGSKITEHVIGRS